MLPNVSSDPQPTCERCGNKYNRAVADYIANGQPANGWLPANSKHTIKCPVCAQETNLNYPQEK